MMLFIEGYMWYLRHLIIKWIQKSFSWSQNRTKAFDILKGKEEDPDEFLNKLKEQIKK
jgi:hypothetical protein